MAKIPLRLYNREIENLIDRGQIEEAIAHCKHILQLFPKHIDTYRLLGKAYLESQRYGDAADIFQRVLSVIPDDFVSQVGMSIIREDEGKLDLAIWHMERAFEVQAANTAVQEELRRLYSRRDGVEPPKVRLTRGALVRMYARGDLYQQAISEIRSALAEDPQRMDMQVLLARMYAQAGMKVEAAEVCSNLIKTYPYCMEANRILAEILPSTSRADDSDIYKQRMVALDPYYAALTPGIVSTADLPDNLITLDRLEWDPMQELGLNQPHWTDSLGIKLDEPSGGMIPDWLIASTPASPTGQAFLDGLDKVGGKPAAGPGPEPDGATHPASQEIAPPPPQSDVPAEPAAAEAPAIEAAVPTSPADMDLIPDWMKESGWVPSDGSFDEIEAALAQAADVEPETGGEEEAEELAPAEIPDWLMAMAPTSLPTAEIDQVPAGGMVDVVGDEVSPERLPEIGEEAVGIPDWLNTVLESPESSVVESYSTVPTANADHDFDLDSLFLEAGLSEPDATSPAAADDIAGESMAVEASGATPSTQPESPGTWPEESEISAPVSEPLMDAVDELHPEEPVVEGESAEQLPAWMQTLEAEAEEPESPSSEELPEELPELPAWLQQLEEEEPAAIELSPVSEGEDTPATGAEELPDWLTDFADSQETALAEPEPEPEPASTSQLPAWLVELKASPEEEAGPEAVVALQPEPEVREPDWLPEMHMESIVDRSDLSEQADLAAESVAEAPDFEAVAREPEPEERTEPQLAETNLPGVEIHLAGLTEAKGEDGERLPAEPFELEPAQDLPFQAELEEQPAELVVEETPQAPLQEMIPETLPAVSDWVQEFNPDDETTPSEGELPISEWKPPEDYVLPPELADLVASIERERAAMEAAGTPPESMEGTALNVPIEMDQDATQAWLDQMATVHSSEAKTVALHGKEPVEKPPKWVEDGKVPPTQSLPGAPTQLPAAEEELPDWLRNLEDENILPEKPVISEAQPSTDQLPTWLQGLDDAEIEVPVVAGDEPQPSEARYSPGGTGPLQEFEIPEVQVFEVPQEIIEISPPTAEEYTPEIAEWLDQIKEMEIPEAQAESPTAVLEEIPQEPVIQEEISWAFEPASTEAEAPLLHLEEATSPPEMDLELPLQKPTDPHLVEESLSQVDFVPISQAAGEPVENQTVLAEAQNKLWHGEIEQALPAYASLIHSGMFLDDIIQDMRNALYQYPIDVRIWETLGDAYARNRNLQEALDAYTKAEELIR